MGVFHWIADVAGEQSLRDERAAHVSAGALVGINHVVNTLNALEGVAARIRKRVRLVNVLLIVVCTCFLGVTVFAGLTPSQAFTKWFAVGLGVTYAAAQGFNAVWNRTLRQDLQTLTEAFPGQEWTVFLSIAGNLSRCVVTAVIAQVMIAVSVNVAEMQDNQVKWEMFKFIGDSLRRFYGML